MLNWHFYDEEIERWYVMFVVLYFDLEKVDILEWCSLDIFIPKTCKLGLMVLSN